MGGHRVAALSGQVMSKKGKVSTSLRAACFWVVLVTVASTVFAGDEVLPIRAALAQPYEVRGSERRQLERFQRLLDREQWNDAFDSAAILLESDTHSVVAIGERRFVSLRQFCHARVSKLPPEVLLQYRSLVDPLAETWYRRGLAERDPQWLRRVVDEMFCSRWGDEALFALGELALEQGQYQAARTYWRQISPQFQQVREPAMLAYPDTNLELASVWARLALVSLYEGELKQAENEIEALLLCCGSARGRLGGRDVVYAEALAELLQQAGNWPPRPVQNDWPTYAGSPMRTNSTPGVLQGAYTKLWSHSLGKPPSDRPGPFPIVLGERVLVQSASQIQALQLETGNLALVSQGEAFLSPVLGRACYTLSGSGHAVFGATTASIGLQRAADPTRGASRLWGIDLQRDGALCFQYQPEKGATSFAGAPVVAGNRLWVALRSKERTARAGIACFDLATRALVWKSWICRANIHTEDWANGLATNLLTYDSGVVYSCTNLGAVTAIRSDDGQPLWVTTYERAHEPIAEAGDQNNAPRSPNPCVLSRGRLFVLPTDSRELLALEAATGRVLLRKPLSSASSQLVGIAAGKLVVADAGFQAFESQSGKLVAKNLDWRLRGQAVLVGETVYWPTEQEIRVLHLATGDVAETALPLPEPGGANLLAAGNYLVAVGRSQITVFQAQVK